MRRPRSVAAAFSIGAVLALVTGAPALAADPPKKPPEATAKPAKETADKDKVECTTEEVAGSLIPKRVCVTQKQIELRRQASRDLNSERRENGGTRTEALGMTPSGTLSGH